MANTINLRPAVLNLQGYAGDGFSFQLICKDGEGNDLNVGGTVQAQVRLDRDHPEDPPLQSFTVNVVDAYLGVIGLSLTGVQTQALLDDASTQNNTFKGVWDVQWTDEGAQPRTIVQGTIEVVADVTR